MAYIEWRMRGPELANCNCDWGCPCQFNALPTRGNCRAMTAMHVDQGHFGDIDLSGTSWAGMFAWPGAIHEGNGEAFVVIDENAGEAQRSALLTILTGGETDPGATIFNVFATVIDTLHPPAFLPITMAVDVAGGTGSLHIPGIMDTRAEPIRNPVTGAQHRAQVVLPRGFEYIRAEFASGDTTATGPIALDWTTRHAHLAMLDLSTHGAA